MICKHTCYKCSRPASIGFNIINEIKPMLDDKGTLWAYWERVSGPHFCCDEHFPALNDRVIRSRDVSTSNH